MARRTAARTTVLLVFLLSLLPAGAFGPGTSSVAAQSPAPGQAAAPAPAILSAEDLGGAADQTRAVVTGDVDNDGDLDIVLGNGHHGYYETVKPTAPSRLYRNDGNGGFTESDLPLAGGRLHPTTSAAMGDLNGDGYLDLVLGGAIYRQFQYVSASRGISSTTLIYLNNGAGAFAEPTLLDTEANPTTGVAIGDVNGDAQLDIVTANYDNGFGTPSRVYLGDGDGTFRRGAELASSLAQGVALGDLNGDKRLDIVMANGTVDTRSQSSPSHVYLSTGADGTFSPPTPLPYRGGNDNAAAVALGDLNGDNALDIVLGRHGKYGARPATPVFACDCMLDEPNTVYFNTAGGDFSRVDPVVLPGGAGNTRALAIGDVNGDGTPDIVTANGRAPFGPNDTGYKPKPLSVLLNPVAAGRATGAFTETARTTLPIPDNILGLALADLDGDADLDLIAARPSTRSLLYRNQSGVGFKAPLTLATRSFPSSPHLVKENKDDTFAVAVGDLNGDEWLDLVTTDPEDGVRAWLNRAGDPGRPFRDPLAITGGRYSDIALGDLDGDGQLDIVLGGANDGTSQSESQLVFLSWEGATLGTRFQPFGGRAAAHTQVALGDLDGGSTNTQQLLDVVVIERGRQEARVYFNVGATSGVTPTLKTSVITTSDHITDVALGDLDNDGDLDLAMSGASDKIFWNDGRGSFTTDPAAAARPPVILPVHPLTKVFSYGSRTVALGDLSGDGALDGIFGSGGEQGAIRLNDGQGGFGAAEAYFGAPIDVNALTLADLNGDGRLDLVVNAVSPNLTAMALNQGAARFGPFVPVTDGWGVGHAVGDINRDGAPDIITWQVKQTPRADTFTQELEYFASHAASPDRFVSSAPLVSVRRPGKVGDAGLYSTPEMLTSQVISVSFTLADPEGDPVRAVRAQYSLDGGGTWSEALAATQGITPGQEITRTSSPTGTSYIFAWDTFASGFFGQSDQVVLRIEALPDYAPRVNQASGPYQRAATSATTFPFSAQGTQVRVVDDQNRPVAGAVVLRRAEGSTGLATAILESGALTGTLDAEPIFATTDADGYLRGRGTLSYSDTLTALAPLPIEATRPYSASAALFATNIVSATGLGDHIITSSGVQTITVTSARPLLLFDLDVSLEWDARGDARYMAQLEGDIRRASELLFDATNGQAALGDIFIWHDKENWDTAHIRVYATSRLRPTADVGGISNDVFTSTIKVNSESRNLVWAPGQIQMGATWNRFGNAGENLADDWSRTLAHELGHYLFFLDDNYIGLGQNNRIDAVESCPGLMADPYVSVELRPTKGWQDDCERTLSNQVSGRSDWETITHQDLYPELRAPEGAFEAAPRGPVTLPLDVTGIVSVAPLTPTLRLTAPYFYVRGEGGERIVPSPRARAYLFQDSWRDEETEQRDRITDLGNTTEDWLLARGARVGDRVCLFDPAAQAAPGATPAPMQGCTTISEGNETLTIINAEAWAPDIEVTPISTATLQLKVTLPITHTGPDLRALIVPGDNALDPVTLTLRQITGTTRYEGVLELAEPFYEATVQVWNGFEEGDEARRDAVTSFSLGGSPGMVRNGGGMVRNGGGFVRDGGGMVRNGGGMVRNGGGMVRDGGGMVRNGGGMVRNGGGMVRNGGGMVRNGGGMVRNGGGMVRNGGGMVRNGGGMVRNGGGFLRQRGAPVTSASGDVTIFGESLTFDPGQYMVLQTSDTLPVPPPPWATPVGQTYLLKASAVITPASKVEISFNYRGRDVPPGEEDGLHIYYLKDGADEWQKLETTLNTYYNLASAALLSLEPGRYALMSSVQVPITAAGWNIFAYPLRETRPISESLASLAGAYTTVYGYVPTDAGDPWKSYVPDTPLWVSDLSTLEAGRGYWINMRPPATLLLRGGTSAATPASIVLGASPNPPVIAPSPIPLPMIIWGATTDLQALPAGTRVEARLSGRIIARATVEARADKTLGYVLKIPGDRGDTPRVEGARANQTITIIVNGTALPDTISWQSGALERRDGPLTGGT